MKKASLHVSNQAPVSYSHVPCIVNLILHLQEVAVAAASTSNVAILCAVIVAALVLDAVDGLLARLTAVGLRVDASAVNRGIFAPEVLLALGEALEPARKDTAWDLVRPGICQLVIDGLNLASGSLGDDPGKAVQDDVADDASDETVRDGVGEWHDGDCEEGGNGVAVISPVDVLRCLGHQRTDDDKGAARSPWREGSKDWCKEDGNEEAKAGHHACDASHSTLGDTSAGFDERGDGRAAEERANGDTERVDEISDGRALEILSALIDGTAVTGHGVEGAGAVENVDIQESDECETKFRAILGNRPVLSNERVLDGMKRRDFLEEIKLVLSQRGVGEIRDGALARPADDGDD